MSVFISYNHQDQAFAERLALALAQQGIKVWKDSWRIGVGDSLVGRIQGGLEGARFFCVVLSKNSLASEWVRREISAGLLREIEEREVMLLPVLIDDCELPLLIREKLYADFRKDFDSGLQKLLSVLNPYYRGNAIGRASTGDRYLMDWGIFGLGTDATEGWEIYAVSIDREESYSVLTSIRIIPSAGEQEAQSHVERKQRGVEAVLEAFEQEFSKNPAHLALAPGVKNQAQLPITNQDGDLLFTAEIAVQVLGDMSKGAVVFNVGEVLAGIQRVRGR